MGDGVGEVFGCVFVGLAGGEFFIEFFSQTNLGVGDGEVIDGHVTGVFDSESVVDLIACGMEVVVFVWGAVSVGDLNTGLGQRD